MRTVDILLPTRNRLASLVMTLAGVAGQTHTDLHVIVADQGDAPAADAPGVAALRRVIAARGGAIEWHVRSQRHGIAEQRQFLMEAADAPYVLYLDDDVFMEPWVLARLLGVIEEQRCGFVGAFPAGLSFSDDVRTHQQIIEWWDGQVRPEAVEPGTGAWDRAQLHRAANQWHLARTLKPGESRLYKVAWVASCVLYDHAHLREVGGFAFWPRLPRYHSGEEVLVQNLLLRRFGGCAIMPSGTYHAELPSTVLNESGTVDGHALDLLSELVERYAPASAMEPA